MGIQLGNATRTARANAIEPAIGTAPLFKLYASAVPANCAAAEGANIVANFALPSDWANAAATGAVAKAAAAWTGNATANGTAICFRIWDSTNTVCHMQGNVGTSATDLVLDNNVVAVNQTITITAFTLTDGNA